MRLRIDELARRAGMTSRTIRAHQARGLLPPPELHGRTGYYGEEHLRRLELIGELQARGFSLEAVRQTLDAWTRGGDLAHLVGLGNILAAPATDEPPLELSTDELFDRFPAARDDPGLLRRAVAQGLLEPVAEGHYRAPSPLLIEAGTELVRAGVPLPEVLGLVEAIRPDVAHIAERFVALVADHLTIPVLEGATDPERGRAALESVRRLKPLALEVVRPFLARELQTAIEDRVRGFLEGLDDATVGRPS